MLGHSLVFPIQDPSQVGEARRAVIRSAMRVGLDEATGGKLGLIATELGTNLLKHAGGGEILFQSLSDGKEGFEIAALDKGPGIADWRRAFEDGFSTAGSPGTGLGAVARLSTAHFAYAHPKRGTVIITRLGKAPEPFEEQRFEVGAVCLPVKGEEECGDSWVLMHTARGVRAVVADGLGHGPLAAEASRAAVRIAREYPSSTPSAYLERAHEALRSTRGAAVALADLDLGSGIVRFAGIGNISAAIVTEGKLRQMVSHNGTAGLQLRRVQEFTYPWTSASTLVMHSDGLATHWSLDAYPGIAQQHASVLAATLYRDFTRVRDDVTVLTLREKSSA